MSRWVLPTATAFYAVSAGQQGAGLVLDGWGPEPDPQPWASNEESSFEVPEDRMPLEYTVQGTRQARGSELIVVDDGLVGVRLTGDPEVELTEIGRGHRLTAVMIDSAERVRLMTVIETSHDHDVVRKWVEIENVGDLTVQLPRVFSAAWPLQVGPGATVRTLAGRWSREFTPGTVMLPSGEFSLGSRQGITSHTYSPVVTVSPYAPRVEPGTSFPEPGSSFPEPVEGHYGIALAWSGSWRMQVDAVPFRDHVRVSGGVDDETTVVTLAPGERFVAPEMHGVFSPDGIDGVQRRWHDYERSVLARTTGLDHRPIVYNSWYATGFDVNVEHQARLADVAAEIGTEVFVVDDGWFKGRHDDTAALGDWTPDPIKFPDGLDPLITAVVERGMRFGIWVEPEGINPDSDLFRAHPDWVYRAGDRPLVTVRDQYVLDFGRAEVLTWAMQMLRTLLADERITYLKWDMNRPISDGGRPGDPYGREWSVQHTRGYYQVMTMLRQEFPHVTVEACSGGGGRIDHAVLAVSDVVWPSDETGPRDRLAIQHGFLSTYPPSVLSSWVTDVADQVDREPTSLEFRFVVAMAGALGIGADLLKWDQGQRDRAAELVQVYREIRETVHTGDVVVHGSPRDSVYVIEYSVDAQVCLLVYARPDRPEVVRMTPRTLTVGSRYRLRGTDTIIFGADEGIEVPFGLAADADVMILDRLS